MDRFTAFVVEHENDDVADIALKRGRWSEIDVDLAASTIAGRRKMRGKVPSWYACAEAVYPTRLCVEQCSSEAACEIKAEVIGGIGGGFHQQASVGFAGEKCKDGSAGVGGGESGVGFAGRKCKDGSAGIVGGESGVGFAGGKCKDGSAGVDWKKPVGNVSEGSRIADLTEVVEEEPRGECVGKLRIADLTGGLGVDSWAFSKFAAQVLYIERDSVLAEAARHNFAALGCGNIKVLNAAVTPEGVGNGGWEVLREFGPDVIYLDPARRGEMGEKVFRLEDCSPDILKLKDKLLELSRTVVVKLSPMADIDEVLRQLDPRCRRADVISVGGECKELMVTMERNFEGECLIVADCGRPDSFSFHRSDENSAVIPSDLAYKNSYRGQDGGAVESLVGKILLEPDKALMKVAAFKLLSTAFGLTKLDVSTHYYICDSEGGRMFSRCNEKGEDGEAEMYMRGESGKGNKENWDKNIENGKGNKENWDINIENGKQNGGNKDKNIENGGVNEENRDKEGECGREILENRDENEGNKNGQVRRNLGELFRRFRILRAEPLNKRTLKAIGKEYPRAEVSARNIPLSSDELRKRLGASGSDTIHIFGLRVASQNLLLVTERLQ